jgi:hypothetical protein
MAEIGIIPPLIAIGGKTAKFAYDIRPWKTYTANSDRIKEAALRFQQAAALGVDPHDVSIFQDLISEYVVVF